MSAIGSIFGASSKAKKQKKAAEQQAKNDAAQAARQHQYDLESATQQYQYDLARAQQQFQNDTAAAALQRSWDLEDRAEARQYSRAVYSNLVADAEAAGFNPLTALRAGGGANYNAAAGFAPLSRQAPVLQAAGMQAPARQSTGKQATVGYSAGEAIGDGLQFAGNFLSNFDPYADQKREAEYRLVNAQIANLNASTAGFRSQSFNVPSYTAGPVTRAPSGTAGRLSSLSRSQAAAVNGVAAAAAQSQTPTVEAPTLTNPYPTSWGMRIDPNWVDASAAETRWGEDGPMALVAGVATFAADYAYHIRTSQGYKAPTVTKVPAPNNWTRYIPSIGFVPPPKQ